MKLRIGLVAMVAVGLTACCTVPDMISFHPLYEDSDVVFDPALLGTWKVNDEVLRIERSQENGYHMFSKDKEKDKEKDNDDLYFKLVSVGGILFADISAQDTLGHEFAKVALHGDRVDVSIVHSEWLREKVVHEGLLTFKEVPHADCKVAVITASPRDLQWFLLRYASVPEAFEDTMEMVRIP